MKEFDYLLKALVQNADNYGSMFLQSLVPKVTVYTLEEDYKGMYAWNLASLTE